MKRWCLSGCFDMLGFQSICSSGRCICAVIAGSEFIRLEREHHQKQSFSSIHDQTLNSEVQNQISAETNIKSTMQLFIKFSAGIVLDSWTESNR